MQTDGTSSIRIAAVSFLLNERTHSVDENIRNCATYAADAARLGADVVCFPETVSTANIAEPQLDAIDDAWTPRFAEIAALHRVNLIAPFLVREGAGARSRATIFDRRGTVAGVYDKVQLNGAELKYLTPGDTLPVFDLDIGRIAVLLCMDIHFPEIARIYALKGADVIFWPTMTHGPTQETLLATARTRASDNSLTLVEANYACAPPYAPYAGRYHPGNARIIDHNGDILAQTGRRDGIAIAGVNPRETRLTSKCVLLREPDHTREDMQELLRLDVFAREYAELARARGHND